MEKERRIKGLSIVALLIAVVGLTIAFAAMNRTLNINNTTAKVGKFNVRFVLDGFGNDNAQNIYKFNEENSGTHDISTNAQIVNNGATVSGIAVQFDMLGVTAEYKLKIKNYSDMAVALDTEYGTNGIQFESGCSAANGISCELTKTDKSALGNLVLSKSGESGDSIYVLFRITANDDPNASTIQETLKENLGLSIKFVQSSGSQAQEQSSGDDPISVDDTDTRYNISFKDLTNVDWTSLDLGMERRKHYYLFLVDNQDQISYFKFTKEEESPVLYVFSSVLNAESEEGYTYESTRNGWTYYGPDEDDTVDIIPSQLPSLNGYRILSASEVNEMSGGEAPDLMTENMKSLLLNITPAS